MQQSLISAILIKTLYFKLIVVRFSLAYQKLSYILGKSTYLKNSGIEVVFFLAVFSSLTTRSVCVV